MHQHSSIAAPAARRSLPPAAWEHEALVRAVTVPVGMPQAADRELVSPTQIADILQQSQVLRVAYQDAGGLTVVPVDFAYDYRPLPCDGQAADTGGACGSLTLFMRSTADGRKVDAIRAAGNALPVAFEMDHDQVMYAGQAPRALGAAHRSLVGTGTASLVADPAERARMLDAFAARSGDAGWRGPEHTAVWKIESRRFTARHRPLALA